MKTNSLKKLSVFGLGLMMQAAFAGNITVDYFSSWAIKPCHIGNHAGSGIGMA